MKTHKFDFYKFIILPLIVCAALALSFYALHDLQTAEGAGLYLSLLSGQSDRTFCDILTDILGMLLFIIVLLLPCLVTRNLSVESFCRFFAAYLAFMPVVHPGEVVHIVEHLTHFVLRDSIVTFDILQLLFFDCEPLFRLLQTLLPFTFLLYAICRIKVQSKKQIPWGLPACIALFATAYLLFSNLGYLTLFVTVYLLLFLCYLLWEVLLKELPAFNKWSRILFLIFLLRGIYRILMLISTSHV